MMRSAAAYNNATEIAMNATMPAMVLRDETNGERSKGAACFGELRGLNTYRTFAAPS